MLPAGPSPLILMTAFYLCIVHKRHNGIQALIRPVLSLIFFSLSLYQYSAPLLFLPRSVNERLRMEALGGTEWGSEWPSWLDGGCWGIGCV